jgi:hypothetical protein
MGILRSWRLIVSVAEAEPATSTAFHPAEVYLPAQNQHTYIPDGEASQVDGVAIVTEVSKSAGDGVVQAGVSCAQHWHGR